MGVSLSYEDEGEGRITRVIGEAVRLEGDIDVHALRDHPTEEDKNNRLAVGGQRTRDGVGDVVVWLEVVELFLREGLIPRCQILIPADQIVHMCRHPFGVGTDGKLQLQKISISNVSSNKKTNFLSFIITLNMHDGYNMCKMLHVATPIPISIPLIASL